jgi:hypothetical protein
MPIVLLGMVLILTVFFTEKAVYFPVDFLFSLRLPFWFSVAIGLLLAAWFLED